MSTFLSAELRKAADASWERNEVAYRYLEEKEKKSMESSDPLIPIRDEASLDLAIAEINRLIDLHPADLTESDSARLDELGSAVHEYELRRNPIKTGDKTQ